MSQTDEKSRTSGQGKGETVQRSQSSGNTSESMKKAQEAYVEKMKQSAESK